MRRLRSRGGSILFAVIACVCTVAGTLLAYIDDRVFDADAFAGLTREALDDDDVRNYLADLISDEILRAAPDAAAGGSAIRDLTATLLQADFMQSLVEQSVRDLHRTVFDDESDSLLLTVSDIAVTVRSQLSLIDPDLAELIPEELNDLALEVGDGEQFVELGQLADDVGGAAFLAVAAALIALMLAVWLDPDHWRGAGHAGIAVALAGGLVLVISAVAASVVGSYVSGSTADDAIASAWDIVFGDLAGWAWTLIFVGGVTCALAWSLLRFDQLATPLDRLASFVTTRPGGRAQQGIRAGLGLVLAVWLIVDPLSFISIIAAIVGIVLAIACVRELLRITGIEERLGAARSAVAEPGEPRISRRTLVALGGGIAVALFVLTAVASSILGADDPAEAASGGAECNGYLELCPRRLDQVAIAATHNSMSASVDGFFLANHTRGILDQLDAGFRGLLIDTWYGEAGGSGPVLTVDPDTENVDPDTQAAVDRARERVTGGGERGVYLCHSFCEIGAVDATAAMVEIRDWLVANPREVVVLFIQDATAPADTASIFEDSGLVDLVFTHDSAEALPTLDAMIAEDRRVFVMVEEDPGDIPWLHDGFTYTQETPFRFASAEEFSCDPNRGYAESPLFQVNHFITPALGSNGSINDLDVLLPRLERCQQERGLLPNLISIDFWEAGDTLQATDALNGVG